MFHAALAEQELWVPEEYAAGFRARLAEIADSEAAHACWRCGWDDADTELLESARHRHTVAQGREDSYAQTRHLLFDAGHSARENGVLLLRRGRSHGKKAGSRPISRSASWSLSHAEVDTANDALPVRTHSGGCARALWDLLHA